MSHAKLSEPSKLCHSCRRILSMRHFYNNKSKRDGKVSQCIECLKKRQKEKMLIDEQEQKGLPVPMRKDKFDPKIHVQVYFRDGTSESIEGATYVGLDQMGLVLRVSDAGSNLLVTAYPIDVVHSWQIVRPGEANRVVRHPAPAGVRYIRKATGLAGEVPVGTVVAWAGTGDVPCGWQAYEWDKNGM